jgi:hypothetical protein
MKKFLKKFKLIKNYLVGKKITSNKLFNQGKLLNQNEYRKPKRTEIINYLISFLNREINYLEIGVNNPQNNFNHINSNNKISVDPGIEYKINPVDYPLTSDEFFKKLRQKLILQKSGRFDIIFIDGLHKAYQVVRDIENALDFITEDGFIVIHDCNPLTLWHASEVYFDYTPAHEAWNGSTWKAFVKYRLKKDLFSCCIDADFGVGILSKKWNIGNPLIKFDNYFYEFENFQINKKEYLNLVDFKEFTLNLENCRI